MKEIKTQAMELPQLSVTLAPAVDMRFRHIPACAAGFWMGSRGRSAREEPVHRVVIEEDFWLAETPVTQAQFAVWTQAAGIPHKNHFDGPNHPAESLTWRWANDFCSWLAANYFGQLPAEHKIASLPTEAQWEYACRAGTSTDYCSGDGETALREVGWYIANSKATQAVRSGEKQPNDWGLWEMHGNVWEWCLDRWDEHAYRRHGHGRNERQAFALSEEFGDKGDAGTYGEFRVLRGGSWISSADWCRSASRIRDWAGDSGWFNGFRVCLVRSPMNKRVSSPASQAAPTASSP